MFDCPNCRGGDFGSGCRVCGGTGVYTPGDDGELHYPKPTAEQAAANFERMKPSLSAWAKEICQTLKK